MCSQTSSPNARRKLSPREYGALRDQRIGRFLERVDASISGVKNVWGGGPAPPSVLWSLSGGLLCAFTSDEAVVTGRPTETLWLIVFIFFAARQEPRFWWELGHDELEHLRQVGGISPPPCMEMPLSPRAMVINYLYRVKGDLPSWLQELPTA